MLFRSQQFSTKSRKISALNQEGVVYSVNCSCGLPYIGETGRRLICRISEHKSAVRNACNKTGLDRHVNFTGHKIDWNSVKILSFQAQSIERKLEESLEIEKTDGASINDNPGMHPHVLFKQFLS